MYFISSQNRFYRWAIRKHFLYRIIITISVILLLWGVWFYGIYLRNESLIEIYSQDIKVLRAQAEQVAVLRKECSVDQQLIDDLQSRTQPYNMFPSATALIQARIIDIITMMNEVKLSLNSCKLGTLLDKNWYTKQTIRFDVTGSMPSIESFFVYLSEKQKMFQSSLVEIHLVEKGLFRLVIDLYSILLKD